MKHEQRTYVTLGHLLQEETPSQSDIRRAWECLKPNTENPVLQ